MMGMAKIFWVLVLCQAPFLELILTQLVNPHNSVTVKGIVLFILRVRGGSSPSGTSVCHKCGPKNQKKKKKDEGSSCCGLAG